MLPNLALIVVGSDSNQAGHQITPVIVEMATFYSGMPSKKNNKVKSGQWLHLLMLNDEDCWVCSIFNVTKNSMYKMQVAIYCFVSNRLCPISSLLADVGQSA